jgi:hypothetical protein
MLCYRPHMGMWGTEPWANDAAADWYDATFALTDLSEHVEQTLNLRVEERADEIRAAAHLVSRLGEHYIWPTDSRVRCIKLAIARLQEMVDKEIVTNPDLVETVQAEIEFLRSMHQEEDAQEQ